MLLTVIYLGCENKTKKDQFFQTCHKQYSTPNTAIETTILIDSNAEEALKS